MNDNKIIEKDEQKKEIKNNKEVEEKLQEHIEQDEKISKDEEEQVEQEENAHEKIIEKPKHEKHLKKNNKKTKIFISIILGILLILILIIVLFSIYNINNEKMINGIKIENIDISNKSVEEARQQIEEYLNKKVNKDIILFNNEYEIIIKPEQSGVIFNVNKTIDEAYNVGRKNNILVNDLEIASVWINGKNLELEFEIDDDIFNKFVIGINENLQDAVKQPSYYIEGNELIINSGKEGNTVDYTKLKDLIYNTVKNQNNDSEKIEIPIENSKPENIDIDKIYNEIHREPQDAYVTKDPFEIHPHIEGIDFEISIEEVKKIIEEPKEQYKIPLKIISPKITNDDLGDEAFPQRLSTYSTKFSTANVNRSTNIRISADKVNGVVLMPGEEISYNNTIGPTTPQNGYKPGAAYIGGKVVTDYGGGVCQTSSTIYNAVLYANLEVTSRTSHYFASDYVPVGRDATVYSPSLDFKFKNNRNYPIKIKAVVNGGTIQVDIFGVKEESDYDVEIESYITSYIPAKVEYENDSSLAEGTEVVKEYGSSGFRSETYKILKKDGNIISRTLVSRDVYNGHSKVIRKGTKKVVPENNAEQTVSE